MTASPTFKHFAKEAGQCSKDHLHEPLEGGKRCKHAQAWTEEFCTHILHDLDNHLTRSAFPAEAVEEDILVNDDAPAPFPTLDLIETPEDVAIGLCHEKNRQNSLRSQILKQKLWKVKSYKKADLPGVSSQCPPVWL